MCLDVTVRFAQEAWEVLASVVPRQVIDDEKVILTSYPLEVGGDLLEQVGDTLNIFPRLQWKSRIFGGGDWIHGMQTR